MHLPESSPEPIGIRHAPPHREALPVVTPPEPICHCGAFTREECDKATALDLAWFDSLRGAQS